MLPGVELARRRRVHYHGDVSASAAGEHGHHHHHRGGGGYEGRVTGPALAARIRLEEKLRGAGPPSSTSSRWSRILLRETSSRRLNRQAQQQQHEEQDQGIVSTSCTGLRSPAVLRSGEDDDDDVSNLPRRPLGGPRSTTAGRCWPELLHHRVG